MKQGSNSGLQAGRLRRIGLNQSDIWFWDRDADFPVHTTEKEKRDGMNIYGNIKALVTYGLETGLLEREDEIFTTHRYTGKDIRGRGRHAGKNSRGDDGLRPRGRADAGG